MVVLRRFKTNTRIEIRGIGGKNRSRCWSIHTTMSKERLMDMVMQVLEPGEASVRVVIRKDGVTSTTCHKVDAETLLPRLQEHLRGKGVDDVKRNRYHFVVLFQGDKFDSKTMSFNAKGTLESVFKEMKTLMEDIIAKERAKDIVFIGDSKKNTHLWQLVTNDWKKRKCKSIILDGYSSGEIVELVRKRIEG